MSKGRRVVVTGMGGITSLGSDWPTIREHLVAGKAGVRKIPEWRELVDLSTQLGAPASHFKHEAFYPRQASRLMGRVSVMAVWAAERALEQAGLTGDPILKSGRTGVACGSSFGSTPPILDFVHFLQTGRAGKLNATSYIRMMGHTTPVNIALYFGLQGRVYTTSSACTSGSQAIGSGFEAIQMGAADVMVAGGAEEFCPTMTMVFDRLYATSTRNDDPENAVKPFDAERDGLVIGEGAGILVLEERERALARGARPLAEIVGYATNCDGAHVTQPTQETQTRVMYDALVNAGVDVASLRFVSGHGTSTQIGDFAESHSSLDVYGARVPFQTLKGNFGHTLGACGATEIWLGVEMMREGWVSHTAGLRTPDPKCAKLNYIMGEPMRVSNGYFASNNFAFGGINTSLVVKVD